MSFRCIAADPPRRLTIRVRSNRNRHFAAEHRRILIHGKITKRPSCPFLHRGPSAKPSSGNRRRSTIHIAPSMRRCGPRLRVRTPGFGYRLHIHSATVAWHGFQTPRHASKFCTFLVVNSPHPVKRRNNCSFLRGKYLRSIIGTAVSKNQRTTRWAAKRAECSVRARRLCEICRRIRCVRQATAPGPSRHGGLRETDLRRRAARCRPALPV